LSKTVPMRNEKGAKNAQHKFVFHLDTMAQRFISP